MIRLSFAEGVPHTREALDKRIEDLLHINREALDVPTHPDLDIAGQFGDSTADRCTGCCWPMILPA